MRRRKPTDVFDRWEPLLVRLALGCLAVLVAAQVLLYAETPRRYLSRVDRLEGEPVTWQTPLVAEAPLVISEGSPVAGPFSRLRPGRTVVIRMVRPPAHPEVFVSVNGARAGDFAGGEARLTVYDGDYVEIDAGRLAAPGRFVVDVAGGGLESPTDGMVVEGRGAGLAVGKVKFKH